MKTIRSILAVSMLLLLSTQRSPAPIQESQETPSPTATSSPLPLPSAASWPGEAFPETRSRVLRPEDIKTWDAEKLRYAINEMYARAGYDFRTPEIKQIFMRLSWYRERLVNGRTQDEAFAHLSALERANLELLQGARHIK